MMLIDRVIEVASELGVNTQPSAFIKATYGIGYRQSATAYLLDRIEDRLEIGRRNSFSLPERVRVVEGVMVIRRASNSLHKPEVTCSFNPALANG
jgi:hypothetical protein